MAFYKASVKQSGDSGQWKTIAEGTATSGDLDTFYIPLTNEIHSAINEANEMEMWLHVPSIPTGTKIQFGFYSSSGWWPGNVYQGPIKTYSNDYYFVGQRIGEFDSTDVFVGIRNGTANNMDANASVMMGNTKSANRLQVYITGGTVPAGTTFRLRVK